jgi:AcrR family transcriptional regulator
MTANTASGVARAGSGRRLPSLGGGEPAQGRVLGRQGHETVRKLLKAGLAAFGELGYQSARVDDVVRHAKISHGTFYLYFSNKNDLLKALLRDTLNDMESIAGDFPVVTRNEAGRAALRGWVGKFCDTYAAHATVIRILSQARFGEEVYGDGLRLFFRLAETVTQGLTVATAAGRGAADGDIPPRAELTAVALLMMLERVNYLMGTEARLPRDEMVDTLTAIFYAAFLSPGVSEQG